MEKIKIGKIVNAVALRGEVKDYAYSDRKERYEELKEILRTASDRADRGCMKLYHLVTLLLFYSLYPHLSLEHAYFVVFVCFSSKSSPHCGHLRSVGLYQYARVQVG